MPYLCINFFGIIFFFVILKVNFTYNMIIRLYVYIIFMKREYWTENVEAVIIIQ